MTAPIDPAVLRPLLKIRPARVWALTLLHAGCWLGAGLGLAVTDAWYFTLPLLAVAASGVMGLIQLDHEAWHGNLFNNRRGTRVFGEALSLLVGIAFEPLRHDHLAHHKYNRTARDPDAYNAGRRSFGLTLLFYAVVVLGLPLSVIYFNILYPLQHFNDAELRRHARVLAGYAFFYTLLFSALVHEGALGLAVEVWLLPILLASPLNGLKSIADHFNNVWNGDRFHTATTARGGRLVTFLWNGLNYHLDHHLYPRVPGYNLPALHVHLRPTLLAKGAPVYDSYLKVMLGALRAGPVIVDEHVPIVGVQRRVP